MSGARASEPVERFFLSQSEERRASVRLGSKATHDARESALRRDFDDSGSLRVLAGQIKQHVLDHLDQYLERAEARLLENGAHVHFATDARAAGRIVAEILERRQAKRVVKSKTMASEEIELEPYLVERGIECTETDLGEFVVQLDRDRPSHIVKPIIHRSRQEIAATFARHGIGPEDDTPEGITRRARDWLRRKYLEADAAITGANFVSAESGRLVIVTNEGNARFCLAATRCHVALVGIEKLVPADRDLAVFLNLLARSATGQRLTAYSEFVLGPRGRGQPDGPDEMHVVFLDNGRSDILAGSCREILRCIRCGACLNVCPVYRQASGHAYRSPYPGPVGAVLSPLLAGRRLSDWSDLPRASTLCGACHEVCPVDIPLEDLLVRLRERAARDRGPTGLSTAIAAWSMLASNAQAWRASLSAGWLAQWLPASLQPAVARGWSEHREWPAWRGGAFRRWMQERPPRPGRRSP